MTGARRFLSFVSYFVSFMLEQRIRIGDSIQVLLTEMEKLLFVLLFFVSFRLFWEVVFILATIMSLRPFVGGMHRKTMLGSKDDCAQTITLNIM